MSTTTIRMPVELKSRIAKVVKQKGTSAHSFILDAIVDKVGQEERWAEFNKTADDRFASMIAEGKSIPWQHAREYLQSRGAGGKAKKPTPRKMG